MPVPYDFDFSGLVGTPYATPPDQVPIKNVRTRFYRGYCSHNAQALQAANGIEDPNEIIIGQVLVIP